MKFYKTFSFLQLCHLLCCLRGKLFYTLAKKKCSERTKKECCTLDSSLDNPKGKNWQNDIEIMVDSSAGPILDFILKRLFIRLYRALKNSKNSYFDKTFFHHLVRILEPVSSDLLFPFHVFCKPWEEGVIILQESGMRRNYGGLCTGWMISSPKPASIEDHLSAFRGR